MANNIERVPSQLDCTNLSTEWPIWKRNFSVYMISSGKAAEPEATKIATFIWLVGTHGAEIYNALFPNDGSVDMLLGTERVNRNVPAVGEVAAHVVVDITQRTLAQVLQRFDEHCIPQRNVAMESLKFNGIVQKDKQSFAEFETDLRTQLRRCGYTCTCGVSYEDRMLRDRIIVGVHDKKLQLKLLDGRDETLTRVIELCKTFEAATANKTLLDNKPTVASIVTSLEPNARQANRPNVCFNCGDAC